MKNQRWLYFALGITTVISIGAVTNQLVPLAPIGGVALSGDGITFPDGTEQTTAGRNPDPPCFNTTRRFVDCGNGTVTDTVTGLIYLKNANCFGLQNWPTANQSAAGLADGSCGLTDGSRTGDWRLQTKEEWEGILRSSCPNDPEIVGNGSPTPGCYSDLGETWASGVVSSFYWSSTTISSFTTDVWSADLVDGDVRGNVKTDSDYVWPVRGGQ